MQGILKEKNKTGMGEVTRNNAKRSRGGPKATPKLRSSNGHGVGIRPRTIDNARAVRRAGRGPEAFLPCSSYSARSAMPGCQARPPCVQQQHLRVCVSFSRELGVNSAAG